MSHDDIEVSWNITKNLTGRESAWNYTERIFAVENVPFGIK